MKVKFKKCPECGNKMIVKKSRKYGSKFWACSSYPDCDKTSEFYGEGARAGIGIDIREIKNGYVITISEKYPQDDMADEPAEVYCKTKKELKETLDSMSVEIIDNLILKVESCDDFDEEPDPQKSEKRTKAIRGETNIKKLIAKMKKTKEKAEKDQSSNDAPPWD